MPYILDVETVFNEVGVTDCLEARLILKQVEQGEYLDKGRFVDRFGTKLYVDELSTGSKALLALIQCKDKVLNFNEVGIQALNLAITLFKEGYIFVNRYYGRLPDNVDIDLVVNNEEYYKCSDEFNEEWVLEYGAYV